MPIIPIDWQINLEFSFFSVLQTIFILFMSVIMPVIDGEEQGRSLGIKHQPLAKKRRHWLKVHI